MNEEERLTQRPGSSNLLFKKKKLQKGGSMYLGKKSLSGKVIEKKTTRKMHYLVANLFSNPIYSSLI